jgi:hypothetical protein
METSMALEEWRWKVKYSCRNWQDMQLALSLWRLFYHATTIVPAGQHELSTHDARNSATLVRV